MKETIERIPDLLLQWGMKHGIKILIIIFTAWLLNKLFQGFIEKIVRKVIVADRYMSQEAEKKREDTLIRIFNGAFTILMVVLASLMALQEAGIPIGPVLAGAGIVGLAVGFGGQYLIRDLISGTFIIMENQYRIGDVVSFDGTKGLVEDISLRMTTLRNLDGVVHHIPHGEIKRVSNLSKDFARINLNIGIAYRSNLEHVITVVNKVGNDMFADPHWKEFLITAPQFVRVDDFADSAIIIKIVGDTQALKQWELTGELRKRLKIAFDQEGIEIPFPQRVVHQPKN
jgi:moderate conductance mechanosensitive channel